MFSRSAMAEHPVQVRFSRVLSPADPYTMKEFACSEANRAVTRAPVPVTLT